MRENGRYLQLESRLRQRAEASSPPCLRPAETDAPADAWIGTADRVPAVEPGPVVSAQTSLATSVLAFDDGAPIELHHRHACPSAPAVLGPPPGAAVAPPGPAAEPIPAVPDPLPAAPAAPPAPEAPPLSAASNLFPPGVPVPPGLPVPGLPGGQNGLFPPGVPVPPLPPGVPGLPGAGAGLPPGVPVPPLPPGVPSPFGPSAAPAAEEPAAFSKLAELDDDDDFARQLHDLVNGKSTPASTPEPPPAEPSGAPAPPAEESRHGVFDQIGEALAPPRTFDLGSVPVQSAFQAIERAMDRSERPAPAVEPPSPPPLGNLDVVEDFALMPPAQAASAPAWRAFTPAAPGTLVVDGVERPAPGGVALRNWSAAGVSQFVGKPQLRTRAKSDVRQIVIHETVSAAWQGISDPALGVQFHLDRDGTLVQHNDAVDMLWHVRSFSEHSVGIEVVNLVFDKDGRPNPGEAQPGDRIPVAWGGALGSHYIVPPAVQLEALAQTVSGLRSEFGIADNWLQVMAHPDAAKAAGEFKDRTFFLMSTGGHLYFDGMANEPWVASHSVLRDHSDGAFETLYCYLRLHKAMAADAAYTLARQIAEDPGNHRRQTHFDAKSGAPLQLLDITDVA